MLPKSNNDEKIQTEKSQERLQEFKQDLSVYEDQIEILKKQNLRTIIFLMKTHPFVLSALLSSVYAQQAGHVKTEFHAPMSLGECTKSSGCQTK
jgi:hypothetical protein